MFVTSLHSLRDPSLRWFDHLKTIEQHLIVKDSEAVKIAFQAAKNDCLTTNEYDGSENFQFVSYLKKKLPNLFTSNTIDKALIDASRKEVLRKVPTDVRKTNQISSFSNWFTEFTSLHSRYIGNNDDDEEGLNDEGKEEIGGKTLLIPRNSPLRSKSSKPFIKDETKHFKFHPKQRVYDIEIPGQYDTLSLHTKPNVDLHTLIVSFSSNIMTLNSKQKPKRITIHGNDEKDYLFLVKGGEDIRLDARIQELFRIFNDIFKSKAETQGYCIQTYNVVPMNSNDGIIEWIPSTITLKSLYESVCRQEDLNLLNASKSKSNNRSSIGGNNNSTKGLFIKAIEMKAEGIYIYIVVFL